MTGTDETLAGKVEWLLNERSLAAKQIELQGPTSLRHAANRLARAGEMALDLLPAILAALSPPEAVGEAVERVKTWQQRCEEHPAHEGVVTESMIQKRMQEEIDDLRAALASMPDDTALLPCENCGFVPQKGGPE